MKSGFLDSRGGGKRKKKKKKDNNSGGSFDTLIGRMSAYDSEYQLS